jgi:hypothetical protein
MQTQRPCIPQLSWSLLGTMTPHDYGDVCSKCDSAFPICEKCSTICSFSGNPCDESYAVLADRPFSEQLRDCPQPLLSNHQTRTVLGADNLLGEKRPSTSSSDTPSKKPRADSKVSPSVSTHKETDFPVLLKMMLPLLNPRWITLPWKTLTIIRLHPGAYGILCRVFSHLRARSHRAWFFSPLLVGSFSTCIILHLDYV